MSCEVSFTPLSRSHGRKSLPLTPSIVIRVSKETCMVSKETCMVCEVSFTPQERTVDA